MSIKTKSGLMPTQSKETPYEITTEQVNKFIQDRFNAIHSIYLKEGKNVDDFTSTVISVKCSQKFVPLMLVMSLSVLDNAQKKKKKEDELDIFNPEKEDGTVASLKTAIYKCIAPYLYNKTDEAGFFAPTFRSSLGIPLKISHLLKGFRRPKIQKLGRNEQVICFIDPLRIFHDMLTDPQNPNEFFKVNVNKCEQIKDGSYLYKISRVAGNGKKDKNGYDSKKSISAELNRMLNR